MFVRTYFSVILQASYLGDTGLMSINLQNVGNRTCTQIDSESVLTNSVKDTSIFEMQGSWIVCGGAESNGGASSKCWIYKKESKEWKNDFSMTTRRNGWTGVSLNGDTYWIAGSTNANSFQG